MSKTPQYDPEEIRYPDQKIVESPLVPEMEKSYIEYAMSVSVGIGTILSMIFIGRVVAVFGRRFKEPMRKLAGIEQAA